jgi:hypothetical protein
MSKGEYKKIQQVSKFAAEHATLNAKIDDLHGDLKSSEIARLPPESAAVQIANAIYSREEFVYADPSVTETRLLGLSQVFPDGNQYRVDEVVWISINKVPLDAQIDAVMQELLQPVFESAAFDEAIRSIWVNRSIPDDGFYRIAARIAVTCYDIGVEMSRFVNEFKSSHHPSIRVCAGICQQREVATELTFSMGMSGSSKKFN